MRCANKFPSHEINAEDDLKTTILNLPKQIRELQQERSSTSFQHHRFYSNSDPLRLKMTYRGVTKTLKKTDVYLEKQKLLKFLFPFLRFSYIFIFSSDEVYSYFHDKNVHFLTTNTRKAKYYS